MREITYKYSTSGIYLTEDSTLFGEDTALKLIVEPHSFSLTLSGEALRKTSFEGCTVEVENNGGAVFYVNGRAIAAAEKDDSTFNEVRLKWKQGRVAIEFGQIETVDNYPNCDGEHDRWSEKWVAYRTVALSLDDNSLVIE